MTNRRILISGAAALALAAPVAASAASGQTIDLYGVRVSQVLENTHGKTLPSNAKIAVGDYVVGTRNVYEGTPSDHSSTSDGTVTSRCRLTKVVTQTEGTASCTATWSRDGSTLTAGTLTESIQSAPKHFKLKIISGTGSFAGAHGTWTITKLSKKDNEIVVHLSA
ncbi:MAG TPA: hypothetical protein VED41_09225 [Solirubrobacteraceae bacterium]|nr:hypothetical protein [Solirubrobacteraceae bacterium]